MKTLDPGHIVDTSLADALGERYLTYALSTITARSLPDVRDGLKPVHRRVLYAMTQLHLGSKSPYKKSARVVGDVIGKFHPHGDKAAYDSMVRLAQDFSLRYPLVDGQGNFGSIDGDGPAAMRYTEARLTAFAEALMEGIDEDSVDFNPTFDGSTQEPRVFPGAVPNLLANGAMGIAVGMASNIPPHNLGEICDALDLLIQSPKATTKELMAFIKGPDFGTGGIIPELHSSLEEMYAVGKGSMRVRARYVVEEQKNGQYIIVITEMPYQVQKAKLIEDIADLLSEKKLPLLGDIRDESTTEIRLVLEPKSRAVDPVHLMETLYKLSDLETKFHMNMNVLDGKGTPRVMSLPEILQSFLDHRKDVLIRRSQNRLNIILKRLEILRGLLIAYLNLDEVINIIRYEDEPKDELMKRFALNEIQADAILNMRLKNLRKLEEMELKAEEDKLTQEKAELEGLLASDSKLWKLVRHEIKDVKKRFGPGTPLGDRRTTFMEPPQAMVISLESAIEKEDVTIVCSEKGWVRALKGHLQDTQSLQYKEGDRERVILKGSTVDKLLVFASSGKFYTIGVDKLPRGRGHGDPINHMIDLGIDDKILGLFLYRSERSADTSFVVASEDGRGFIVNAPDLLAQTKGGKQILNLADGKKAALCIPVQGDSIAVVGQNRKLLIFSLSELPTMTRGRGVTLQKYKDAHISDIQVFEKTAGITFGTPLKSRTVTDLRLWTGKRGQTGRLVPTGFPRNNTFWGT